MSNPVPQKRKRAYRHRVKCSECKKEIVAEYQDAHARTKHVGKKVKFSISRAPILSLNYERPSRRLQALVGERAQRQTQLTPESYHRINTFMLPSTRYCPSLSSGEMTKKSSVLWEISVTVKHLIKKSFSCIAKFYNIDGEILEAEQKMYASFRRTRGLGYMTVSEILETMYENDLFDIFPEFSKVVHILAVIPATSCSVERSFSALRRLKTYLRNTMGQQRVSNITLINIERAYANSVVSNDMDGIIDIFGRRNGRDSYFF